MIAIPLRPSYGFIASLIMALVSHANAQAPDAPTETAAKITVTVNKVLVPVLVRNSQGRTVGNLKKEDFQIFDENKQRAITGFTIEERSLIGDNQQQHVPPSMPSQAGVPQKLPAEPNRFIVFLFDDMHLDVGDISRVQKAAEKMFATSLTDSDAAAVVSFSGLNSGLTRDRVKLHDAVLHLKAQNLYRHIGRECPDIDYYQADLIINKHNETAFQSAVDDAQTCASIALRSMAENQARSAASRALSIGDQDVRVSLSMVRQLVKRMSTLPGQRLLILVSPGFLTVTAEAMYEKSLIMDLAAQSEVTISTLDARGMYTTEIDASERGANTSTDLMTGSPSQNRRDKMSLHEDVMAEFADATGGTFFHNNNDLAGGFKKLTEVPEFLYVLEFSLDDVKQNNTYHHLKVKVNQDGLKLQARRGYFAPSPEKTKK
jgi:VWFA-related protein